MGSNVVCPQHGVIKQKKPKTTDRHKPTFTAFIVIGIHLIRLILSSRAVYLVEPGFTTHRLGKRLAAAILGRDTVGASLGAPDGRNGVLTGGGTANDLLRATQWLEIPLERPRPRSHSTGERYAETCIGRLLQGNGGGEVTLVASEVLRDDRSGYSRTRGGALVVAVGA